MKKLLRMWAIVLCLSFMLTACASQGGDDVSDSGDDVSIGGESGEDTVSDGASEDDGNNQVSGNTNSNKVTGDNSVGDKTSNAGTSRNRPGSGGSDGDSEDTPSGTWPSNFYSGADGAANYKMTGFPKSPLHPDKLYVIGKSSMTVPEASMIASLQGILAKKKPQIYINSVSAYSTWLLDLETRYGVETEMIEDPWELVAKFKNEIKGYILYTQSASDTASLNVATTLSGIEYGIVVEGANEAKAKSLGLTRVADVRGKNDKWTWDNYKNKVSKQVILDQRTTDDRAVCVRDYATMTNALTCFSGILDGFLTTAFSQQNKNGIVLGWPDSSIKGQGEDQTGMHSSSNGQMRVASDWSWNLSVLSGFYAKNLNQKTNAQSSEITNKKRHVVTFILTDGDNIQWLLGGFKDPRWWDTFNRGKFNMGWGMSDYMIEAAPTVMDYYYRNASNNAGGKDYFVVGPNFGYADTYKPSAFQDWTKGLADRMKQADLKYVQVVEPNQPIDKKPEVYEAFTKHDQIKGIFYLPYEDYRKSAGKHIWSNGKPVISARYELWGVQGTHAAPANASVEYVVEQLKKGSTDISSADAYSFVTVHCWSMTVGGDVKRCIDLLQGSNVEVVTPDVFMQTFTKNVKK